MDFKCPGCAGCPKCVKNLTQVTQLPNHVETTIFLRSMTNQMDMHLKNRTHPGVTDLTGNQHCNELYHVMSPIQSSNQSEIQSLNQVHPEAAQVSSSNRYPECVMCSECYAVDAERSDQYRCIVCPMKSTPANK